MKKIKLYSIPNPDTPNPLDQVNVDCGGQLMNPELMIPNDDSFIASLRELSRRMGIRQKELADSLGLKPAQMNLYFQGKVEMRGDRLLKCLKIFGIDIEAQIKGKIRELGGEDIQSTLGENKLLAVLGSLDESKKKSIWRIIKIIGAK